MSMEIVSRIAYLVGVENTHFSQFNEDIINQLKNSNDCSLIRKLCQLRTILLLKYYEIERELKDNKGKISEVSICRNLYDSLINKHGIDIEMYSYDVNKYIEKLNSEIKNNIALIKPLFPPTLSKETWNYISDLFLFPNNSIKTERKKLIYGIDYYPYKCYINFKPKKEKDILEYDTKLLSVLYSSHGKEYKTSEEELAINLYSFIKKCSRVIICVDCENVDHTLFYTALEQFNSELIAGIEKVILFNDNSLVSGWKYYKTHSPVSSKYIECPRIQKDKSSLDVRMSAYITAVHYKEKIDGFILTSSDSDYWGLIDTIGDTANFFVLAEKEKISTKCILALENKMVPYSFLDDYNNEEIKAKIKEKTFKTEIIEMLKKSKFNIDYFANILQNQIMYLSEDDKAKFKNTLYDLKISFDKEGNTHYTF